MVLEPRETFTLPIPRLVSRSGAEVRYTYWTEPGLYTVTAQVRMLVARAEPAPEGPPRFGPPRARTFATAPVTVDVRAAAR